MLADTDGDGTGDLADADATFMSNPMKRVGAPAPFTLSEALVENNYVPVKKVDAPDHRQMVIKNSGATELTGFSIYVAIKDNDNGRSDGSFRKLDGLIVPAGGEARIHFDNGVLPGHFRANPNSIHAISQAVNTFSVAVRADGFAPVMVEIAKDKGGAELAD